MSISAHNAAGFMPVVLTFLSREMVKISYAASQFRSPKTDRFAGSIAVQNWCENSSIMFMFRIVISEFFLVK